MQFHSRGRIQDDGLDIAGTVYFYALLATGGGELKFISILRIPQYIAWIIVRVGYRFAPGKLPSYLANQAWLLVVFAEPPQQDFRAMPFDCLQKV